jgi:hypothetical protein
MRPARQVALAAMLLLAGCVTVQDTDGDGLEDASETQAHELRVSTAKGSEVRSVTSDPGLPDTDGDGLTDGDEADLLTDPRDADSDGDGLLDGPNMTLPEGDARIANWTQRGILRNSEGDFVGEAALGSKPFDWDSDRPFPDGVGDGDEARGRDVTLASGSRHVTSDPKVPDTDLDGLVDGEEHKRGCDPRVADTDADGVPDPSDTDCARNVQLVVAFSSLRLDHGLDPSGDTELQVVAQAAGQSRTFTQAVRAGGNALTMRWLLDLRDEGPWHNLTVPVALEFWDQDFVGDDAQSGVARQPVRVVGDRNSITLEFDLFHDAWTASGGMRGDGHATLTGTDGSLTFALELA